MRRVKADFHGSRRLFRLARRLDRRAQRLGVASYRAGNPPELDRLVSRLIRRRDRILDLLGWM